MKLSQYRPEQLIFKIVFNELCFVIGVSYKTDLSYKYYIDALESWLTQIISYSANVIYGDDFLKDHFPAEMFPLDAVLTWNE